MDFLKKNITGIVEVLLGIILTLGVLTVFGACGATPEGKMMACHWAENVVKVLGIVFILLGAVRIVLKDKGTKKGISIALLALSVVTFLIPGKIISLCMMDSMACHSAFKPFVTVLSVLLALSALADIVILSITGKDKE